MATQWELKKNFFGDIIINEKLFKKWPTSNYYQKKKWLRLGNI